MSTSTSTTIISTKKSAVFRAYPWSNGVVLAEDTRAFMEKALEGRGHCEKLVKMALVGYTGSPCCSLYILTLEQTLASCVDDTVNVQIDDPNTRTFIREFLGPDDSTSSIEEARSSLLTGSRSQRPSNKNLVTAAHIIFRYRLLDIVADVLETPRHADVSLVPKNPAPDFKIDRLTKVINQSGSSLGCLPFYHILHRCLVFSKTGQNLFRIFASLTIQEYMCRMTNPFLRSPVQAVRSRSFSIQVFLIWYALIAVGSGWTTRRWCSI